MHSNVGGSYAFLEPYKCEIHVLDSRSLLKLKPVLNCSSNGGAVKKGKTNSPNSELLNFAFEKLVLGFHIHSGLCLTGQITCQALTVMPLLTLGPWQRGVAIP